MAAIGMPAFLDRTLSRIYLHHLSRAAKIGDEIDRKIHLFLNRDDPAEVPDLPPFDFKAVRSSIETQPLPQHIADLIDAFGELSDVGLAAVQVVDRVQGYLAPKVPHRIHQSLAGPTEMPPPHSDVARFRRLWNVACDPLSILDDINAFALSRDLVQGVFDMFPLIWQRIDAGVTSQLGRKKSQNLNFTLTIRKELQLRVLVRQEDENSKRLGRALQAQFAAQAAENAPKPPQAQKKAPSVATTESSASDRIGSE